MIYKLEEINFPKKCIGTFIKGFASRLDFNTENNRLATELFFRYVNPETNYFFWDGDDYATDSFTFLLERLMEKFPDANFIACKKEDEFDNFKKSWQGFERDIGVYLMPSTLSWDKLGIDFYKKVISRIKTTEIICIGGGETLQKEFVADKRALKAQKNKVKTTWYIISFDRKSKDGLSMDNVFQIKNNPNRFILEIKWCN